MRARFFSLVLIISSVGVFAQANDPVIMSINGKNFKKSEFEYFFNKYNNEEVIDKRSLSEYIELFRNLKLKVAEAESFGMDTTVAFIAELSGYRSSLAQPYLDDMEINEEFVRTEYERMKERVEVSHILIAFPGIKNNNYKTLPSDTLIAFKKAEQIRNRLLKGENFEKLAKEFSDDPAVTQKGRPGYLGWFMGLNINPIFEDVAFNTPVGKIGRIVRSIAGYHIFKIHAKKDNFQINAAHILIPCPPEADLIQVGDAQKKIDDIYSELMNGAVFSDLAREHSKDPGSATNGGELGWFGINMMVPEFQDVAFDLKEVGDVSKPVKTQFGYHIIKLLGKRSIEPFNDKRKEIEGKLKSSGFFIPLYQPEIDKMKKEYNFQKDDAGYQLLFSKADTLYPVDSLYLSYFETESHTLFTIGNTKYTISQFINFMKKNVHSPYTLSTELLKDRLQTFEYNSLFETKDKSLENKYPEFRNLIQEYRDGTLMFEISNREVWAKSNEDIEGLTAYFDKNKKNYVWDEPYYKGYVVLVKDANTKKKMQKEISRKSPDDAIQYLYDNYRVGDVSYVKAEKGLFKKGDNAFVDEAAFKSGYAERDADLQDFFLVGKVLKMPESYIDVKGVVSADYQDYLEEDWLKKLNEKYIVVVYPEVLDAIK